MPTQPYYTADKKRVPGVTTVIGASLGWNKEALMRWAHRMGGEGKSYEAMRQKQATAGTLAHELVERNIAGEDLSIPEGYDADIVAQALEGFSAYRRWFEGSRLVTIETEAAVVSETYRTGGCIDAIIRDDSQGGALAIGDWKTSGGLYPDMLIQVAAYRHIYEEARGVTVNGGYHLVKFGKDSAHFSHHWWPSADLDIAWEAFKHLRALYDAKKVLTKLAR